MYNAIQTKTAALLLAFASTTGMLHAGSLHDELENTFNGMVHVTDPQGYSTQQRGGFTAGRYTAKAPILNESLLSASAPGYKAGCGGIDLYGGSFSHINKEQFVELGRAIASNATGFLFHQALNAFPDIANALSKMQDIVDHINKLNVDSCEAAEGIVIASGIPKMLEGLAQRQNTEDGTVEDTAESRNPPDNKSPSETLAEFNPEEYIEKGGNIIWAQLKRQNIAALVSSGDDDFLQDIMSVTGAVVLRPTNDAGEVNKSSTPEIYPGIMTLEQVVFGGDVSVWRCDETDDCLKLNKASDARTTGIYKRLREYLMESDSESGAPSILEIMRDPDVNVTLSDDHKKFLLSLPADTGTFLNRLARVDPDSAHYFTETLSKMIAVEMTYEAMSEIIDATQTAVAVSDKVSKDETLEMLAERSKELDHEYTKLQQTHGSLDKAAGLYNAILKAIDRRAPKANPVDNTTPT